MSDPWKLDVKLVCNEGFKIDVLINGAQQADMTLHHKHFYMHSSRAQILEIIFITS